MKVSINRAETLIKEYLNAGIVPFLQGSPAV